MRTYVSVFVFAAFGLLACPPDPVARAAPIDLGFAEVDLSGRKEPIDAVNNPSLISGAQGTLQRTLSALANRGQSAFPVWTGSWWPLSQGGTAARPSPNQLSPVEKLDQVTNGRNLATDWEKETAERWGNVSWAGHCNGLAAASVAEKAPRRSVTYRNVVFSVQDVQALLVELYQGSGRIVGGRCERVAFNTDPNDRIDDPACRDLNPGAFHLALGNFLGQWRSPVIIDNSPGQQVWNYPITSFSSTVTPIANAVQAAREVGDRNPTSYRFNPNAVAFAKAKTRITLSTGASTTYDYLLELDAQGRVIGGEWIGDSKFFHPDFIWRPNGVRTENPYIDVATARAIAAQAQAM